MSTDSLAPRASDTVIEQRKAICVHCPTGKFAVLEGWRVCTECKCNLEMKVLFKNSVCPDGHWKNLLDMVTDSKKEVHDAALEEAALVMEGLVPEGPASDRHEVRRREIAQEGARQIRAKKWKE